MTICDFWLWSYIKQHINSQPGAHIEVTLDGHENQNENEVDDESDPEISDEEADEDDEEEQDDVDDEDGD